jgi:16S rRNA processing protein RimM
MTGIGADTTQRTGPGGTVGGTPDGATARVLVGEIVSAHGIRGSVKLKSFTADPAAVAGYGPLTDEAGRRRFALRVTGAVKGLLIADVEGVRDRNAAEALRGVRLYVDRDRLPPPDEEEFYHADLIGLPATTVDGRPFGTVAAIFDFGAGDMLEIRLTDGRLVQVPFTKAAVPHVDVAGRRVTVDPPAGLLEPAEGAPGPEDAG